MSKSKWTHSVCERCWIRTEGTFDALGRLTEVRRPTRFLPEDMPAEFCCFCGEPTISGIYVRRDPRSLNCSHSEVT